MEGDLEEREKATRDGGGGRHEPLGFMEEATFSKF